MSINTKKSKQQDLGYFQTEKKAQDYIEHFKKFCLMKNREYNFIVVKKDRLKEGQKPWFAYCLHKKLSVS